MTAAAVIAHRERQIVEAFRRLHATSADAARPLGAVDVDESVAFRRLTRRAVIRPGRQPGTYYVDEPSWAAVVTMRRRLIAVVMVLVALGVILGVIATGAAAR